MASLVSFYNFQGAFINQMIATINIQKKLKEMDSGTLVIQNVNTKLSSDLIKPGNFVTVEDENLQSIWISVVVAPTSINENQATLALVDPKSILVDLPILSTEGLGLGIVSVQGIAFAINSTRGRHRHRFVYTADESGFTFSDSPLAHDGVIHLGKSLYVFLNELAEEKHFEWWLEPSFSQDGSLGLTIRTENIRKSIGQSIYIPQQGIVQGIGLSYSNKYYTALAVMGTNRGSPIFKRLITFPGLIDEFGLVIKTIEDTELHGKGGWDGGGQERMGTGAGRFFKELRPRRSIQLHINTKYEQLIASIELGSVHHVSLGNIGFTDNNRGIELPMRTIAMSYNSGENVMGIVLEEFFETDEFSVLSL